MGSVILGLTCAFVLLTLGVVVESWNDWNDRNDGLTLRAPSSPIWSNKPIFSFQYPDVRRDPTIVDDYFGQKITDYYRWLEDPDSEETKNFVECQNNLTQPYLKAARGRDLIRKRLETIMDYKKYGVPEKRGNRYFTFMKTGLQNQAVLYVQNRLNDPPRVLIDPNMLSDDGTVAITETSPSNNGELYAYGLSSKGSDWVTVHFRNVSSGSDLGDTLQYSKWPGVEWNAENSGVFYSAYPKPNGTSDGSETTPNEYMKIFFHRLGTSQDDDIIIAEFLDFPKRTVGSELSEEKKYLIISAAEGLLTNMIYYIDMKPLVDSGYKLEKPELKSLLVNNDAKYDYVTSTEDGNVMYFRTNKNAPNYRIIGVYLNNPSERYWATLVPENSKDVLNWASPINNDKLVTSYIHDVKTVLEVRRLRDGSLLQELDIGIGTIGAFTGERKDSMFFFSFSSYLTPGRVYSVNLEKGYEVKLRTESTVEGFDASLYVTKQIFYTSKDGTKIPMFLVHKKDLKLDGTAPTLLYGYGGFDISLQPEFSERRLAFIQLFNGVAAVANLRGGGEYGQAWHDGGRLLNKQNTFDDFQAAARYLIENNYTRSEKLTIQGGSNGGLLVGACVNQAPELFGAAIAQVGVLDMLRYQKFTIGYAWASDYGTSDNETEFDYLIRYSPYHNIRLSKDDRVQYPAVLVTTGDHDDRVVPLHSYKYVSELQYTIGRSARQSNPLLILVETNAGHGGGKPTSKTISETVDIFSFLVQTLNLKVAQPTCSCTWI